VPCPGFCLIQGVGMGVMFPAFVLLDAVLGSW
jgi:hypothetical protein